MKNVYLLAVLFICSLCLAQPDGLKYTLTAGRPEIKKASGEQWLQVWVTLTNTTKDTLKYYTMTCSWQNFYCIDNPDVKIEDVPCDKNIFTLITLPPGKSNTVLLKLYPADNSHKQLSFKIGMNLVFYRKLLSSNEIRNEMDKRNIIWTKPITVKLKQKLPQ